MKKVNLQSTNARGRNGWFRASTASIFEVQRGVYLDIYSKKILGSVLEDEINSKA